MALKLAIVGRPNVGKSTLFNRLAGKKLAIVDDQPGVTRDRRFGRGTLGDLDLDLIDTAGYEDAFDDSLQSRMRAQTDLALEEADIVLFVVDAREGVTPLDTIFADRMRRAGRRVILIANKAEGRQGDSGIVDAFRLGLGEPLPISAEHGEGMADLYAAIVERSSDEEQALDEEPDAADRPVSIAVVGRPNAGKSTLVNRMIGEDRLLVGPEAGITRDAIAVDWEWGGRRIRLVDTAGLRRKARINERLEKLSTADSIRAITYAEVVLLVMDATHPFEVQDLQLADLVEREGRALVFVLSKWDLVENPAERLKEFVEHAEHMLPQLRGSPVIPLSGESGRGIDKLMPALFKHHANWSTKVKTRDLNDWLAMAVQRHPPPSVEGKRMKLKYMAQTKSRPPTFVLFASRAADMPESYRRYLVNSMRESFDLPGVPVRITVKASNARPSEPGQHAEGKPGSRAKALAQEEAPAVVEEEVAAKPAKARKKPQTKQLAAGKPGLKLAELKRLGARKGVKFVPQSKREMRPRQLPKGAKPKAPGRK
ncbi:MAG: der [Caulobacteraceae bacterium]|nr:der [Caulobacteraceae bacterium]